MVYKQNMKVIWERIYYCANLCIDLFYHIRFIENRYYQINCRFMLWKHVEIFYHAPCNAYFPDYSDLQTPFGRLYAQAWQDLKGIRWIHLIVGFRSLRIKSRKNSSDKMRM